MSAIVVFKYLNTLLSLFWMYQL